MRLSVALVLLAGLAAVCAAGAAAGGSGQPRPRVPGLAGRLDVGKPVGRTPGAEYDGKVFAYAGVPAPAKGDRRLNYLMTGQAWGDYDQDGWPDLYVTSQIGPNTLYHNERDGTFTVSWLSHEVALPRSVSGGAAFADYDNDGWPDLYVTAYGRDVLFHNEHGRGFVEVTGRSGIRDFGRGTTASWGDYNGDGYLDLYVVNYGCDTCYTRRLGHGDPDRLYHNNGDGTFTDVTRLLPPRPLSGWGFAAGWADIDNDGDPDLYLVNDARGTRYLPANALFRNDGRGCGGWCFRDVSKSSGAGVRVDGMGLAVGDYDGDGNLDLYVTNSGWAMTPLTGPSMLLRNRGDGTFRDVAARAAVDVDAVTWGATFLDYDNDGLPDLYVALGGGPQDFGAAMTLNRLLRNRGDGTFADATLRSGASYPDDTVGVAAADYNNDGWLDLVTGNLGRSYDLYTNAALVGRGHHRLTVRLRGAGQVNVDAVGARVYLATSDGRSQLQEVMDGSSIGGGNDLALHFGLGKATVSSLRVRWPDGHQQTFRHVRSDVLWRLTYGGRPSVMALADPRIQPVPFVLRHSPGGWPEGLVAAGLALLTGALTSFALARRVRRRGAAPAVVIRGRPYPVLLPRVSDPRLHLAAVIVSLQVLGQTAFGFRLSIAQILVSLGTCAVLEVGIAFWRQQILMWPASALLTGNGVAFILRVPGTRHGDWWSLRGAWVFAATAALGLLSKYVLRFRGRHLFNPSNIALVVCFLALPASRAEPLDFWWGPMSTWLALAVAIIVAGGLAILLRLRLLTIAAGFWLAFAAGIGVLALSGHEITARWHLGPISDGAFWRLLVSSPEILVFLFFMITDPKTVPGGRVARLVYGAAIGLAAALLVAPQRTEYGAKVAVLGALAIVCAARPLLDQLLPAPGSAGDSLSAWARRAVPVGPRRIAATGGFALAASASLVSLLVLAGSPARSSRLVSARMPAGSYSVSVPRVTILPSKEVASQVSRPTALRIARNLVTDLDGQAEALRQLDPAAAESFARGDWLDQLRHRIREGKAGKPVVVPSYRVDHIRLALARGRGQSGAVILATIDAAVSSTVYTGSRRTAQRRVPTSRVEETLVLAQGGDRYVIAADRGRTVPGSHGQQFERAGPPLARGRSRS